MLTRVFAAALTAIALGVACTPSAPPPLLLAEPTAQLISYVDDVKPVLDRRCVVCHSCYNAACQLKLSSFEGVDRGGSKIPVYRSSRLREQPPTRLFFDALSTEEWRGLDFHSVTQSRARFPLNDSTMLYMLEAKRKSPKPRGEYHAEAADLSCPANPAEVGQFLGQYPERGMPFGFPPLSTEEHTTLATWLTRGAPGPSSTEQARLTMPSPGEKAEIKKWETFLNASDAKHAMTARYLYEHFFLAHIRFSDLGSDSFFEIIRSTSPPGSPVIPIATTRPYDDPGTSTFYYRFRKIHSTIMQKTHMVVDLNNERMSRYQAIFLATEWLEDPHWVPFQASMDANPFVVYAQIPPTSRYMFLLDHSEYILRSFMQGPVCKGQVALNVIHDHFWVMFLDPSADLSLLRPSFLTEQANNLRIPNEQGGDKGILSVLNDRYRERYVDFYQAKSKLYDELAPEGPSIDAIWKGWRASDSPLLTVYRHFDSASLHRGTVGNLPRTLWVIDYSQLERIYYSLVAGFDVFGNVTHQVSVRLYMDYLRMEGELNFVHFLPAEIRAELFRSWYVGAGAIEDTAAERLMSDRGTRVRYDTDDPKREFIERIVDEYLPRNLGIDFDPENYRRSGEHVEMPASFKTHEDVLQGMRALTAPGTAFIRHMTSSKINVIFVRIRNYQGDDRFVSIVINRWHDNINSLFFESKRLDSTKDTLDFIQGGIGSYPNYFLDVNAEDLPEFFDLLAHFDESPEYQSKVEKFGINRADPRFWELYDWFQAEHARAEPVRSGLYDLNRYYPLAVSIEDSPNR